jgi:hypothetical protein
MPSVYLSRQKIECHKPFRVRPAVMVWLKDGATAGGSQRPQRGRCEDFPRATVCVESSID